MTQLFQRRANAIAHAAIAGGALLIAGACGGYYAFGRSAYWTRTEEPLAPAGAVQPELHLTGLGIDCRY